jgi:hypothetical protein
MNVVTRAISREAFHNDFNSRTSILARLGKTSCKESSAIL